MHRISTGWELVNGQFTDLNLGSGSAEVAKCLELAQVGKLFKGTVH